MLVGFLMVLIAVLALPVLIQQTAPPAEQESASEAEAESSGASSPAAPVSTPPQQQQQQQQQRQQRRPARPRRPTAKDFENTKWEVHTPQGQVQVSLLPGGKARAKHSMVGTVEGNWRLQGNQIHVSANVMGQSFNISCQVKGNALMHNGVQIRRLR